mmetsp:Transcript_13350/g.33985  ORF Transcript_13350/g.33985 Transcript_13350/m.33985 type:complete len:205 (+) Transcript_13350:1041-1655(+)
MGESVPEVITTLWKRSKTCLMAMEASRQHSCITGSGSEGVRSSDGSSRMEKPCSYVAHMVANSATSVSGWYSCTLVTSKVRSSERNRSEQNLSALASTLASSCSRARKRAGRSIDALASSRHLSSRPLTCRTMRCRKVTKCSARRMLPGTASESIDSGRDAPARRSSALCPVGSAPDCASPFTRLWYSRLSRCVSTRLSRATSE